ncbi:MAG TPA: prephenate dehydrogenase [Candidatus Brocadiia bacterium]|nr:prephenate dehydrogenase [Candidatus Brocadiales bacterium]
MLGTVAIVGTGLIGGSIALGIKKRMLASRVVGIGHQKSSIEKARQLKAVDACTLDITEGVRNADIVILATPVNLIVELAREAIPHMKGSAILTDVGSTKSHIVTEIKKSLRNDLFFVGGHPMAGSEQRGIEWASADLFEGSTCILTPDGSSASCGKNALKKIATMWESLGANVKFLSPEEHDEVIAYVSHLPHFIASSLVNVIKEDYWQYAAGGLRDTTRIASSDADLWLSIYGQNRAKIISAIDVFLDKISAFKAALANKDDAKILEMLKRGKQIRDSYVSPPNPSPSKGEGKGEGGIFPV